MTEREKKIAEIRERYERARTMITALCAPKFASHHRDWLMSIPAQPDYDPDIVITDSLQDIPKLLSELEAAPPTPPSVNQELLKVLRKMGRGYRDLVELGLLPERYAVLAAKYAVEAEQAIARAEDNHEH